MKKALISLILALCLLCSCLPAMAAQSPAVNPKGTFPITNEKITLRVWCNLPEPMVNTITTNDATVWLEEKTNIHLDWEIIDINGAAEKLRVMMAANADLPDIIMFSNTGAIQTTEQIFSYGMQGLLRPLNDLIAEYGDAYFKAMKLYDYAEQVITAPDGNIYGLPSVSDGAYHASAWQRFYINKAWLDKLNLEVPTTIDDFYKVLVAFRDQDPNENGVADEIPLSGSKSTDYVRSTLDCFLMNAFQYSTSWENCWLYQEEPGKVACGAVTEGYREGLRWFKKLYDEGLMDKEIFINNQESLKMLTGAADGNKLGSFSAMFQIAALSTDNPEFGDYVALSPLEGPNGRVCADNPVGGAGFGYLITSACKYPEAAFRLGDYLMTIPTGEPGNWDNMTVRYGLEGVGWEKAHEGDVGIDGSPALIRRLVTDQDENGNNSVYWHDLGCFTFPQSERNAIAMADPNAYNIEADLYAQVRDYYEPFRVKKSIPKLVFSEEDTLLLTDIRVNIQNYGNEAMAMFVTGQWDLDKDWDNYVETMNTYGLKTLIERTQATYDAFVKQ